MPDVTTNTVRELVRFFALALQARSRRRLSIFEAMVSQRFDSFRNIHEECHALLLPIDEMLFGIQSEIAASGNDVRGKLGQLSEALRAIAEVRQGGRINRQALYIYCLELSRSTVFQTRGFPQPLREAERALLVQFMGGICKYFETSGRYEHEFGSTLGGLISTVDYWLAAPALGVADIEAARKNLRLPLQRMTDKWAQVMSVFSRLELALKMDLKISISGSDHVPAPSLPFRQTRAA